MDSRRSQKASEKRKAWREANSERIRWEMFLRNYGPDSFDWLKEKPESAEDEAAFAHREMLQRVLNHFKGHIVDYDSMSYEERAFAHLFEDLFLVIDDYDLLDEDIDHWRDVLELEISVPFVEVLRRIDEHLGNSDWREICYREEKQRHLMKELLENYEAHRNDVLRRRALGYQHYL
jgi:hypothetical protein